MTRAEEIIDEDDWVEVERASRFVASLCDVSVRITVSTLGSRASGKNGPRARVNVTFRGKAAEWIKQATRFRLQIGGAKANKVRFIPDNAGGKFEWSKCPKSEATIRIVLGIISAWPSEDRPPTEATWAIESNCMVLTLPETFAVPTQKRLPPPEAPPTRQSLDPPPQFRAAAPASAQPAKSEPVRSLADLGGVVGQRNGRALYDVTAQSQGDPPPHRSALNNR